MVLRYYDALQSTVAVGMECRQLCPVQAGPEGAGVPEMQDICGGRSHHADRGLPLSHVSQHPRHGFLRYVIQRKVFEFAWAMVYGVLLNLVLWLSVCSYIHSTVMSGRLMEMNFFQGSIYSSLQQPN